MNKLKMTLCLCIMSLIIYAQPTAPESNFIKVDQFGYLPSATKVAVISNPQVGYNANQSFTPGGTYQVREWSSGDTVFSGSPQIWNKNMTHSQSGDKGWWFDFSSVTTAGTYYLYDTERNVRSYEFDIRDDVYNDVLKAATRMFYYNRSGIAKVAPYAESGWRYNGAAFQQQDSNCRYYLTPNDASSAKNLDGGWFDAGDYNKYVTFQYAGRAVHDLLWAYRENPTVFGDNWNIPESGNGIPDVLDELKWELDWLMKMNNADGSTHIKMGSIDHNQNNQAPPDANTTYPRYYGKVCSSASISVAGMFAHAAKVFQDIPGMSGYAQELRSRAETSWNYVLPALNNNQLDTNCDDQTIKSGDADETVNMQREYAVAAAIHLFELTGKNTYNQYIINNTNDVAEQLNSYWGYYRMPVNDALLLYTTLANNSISNQIKNSIQQGVNVNSDDAYGFNADADLYRTNLPFYDWGSNRQIGAIGALNQLLIKYGVNPDKHADYELRTNEMAHYIHGVNPQGKTYLSNMYDYGGDNCANEIYHEWFKHGTEWDDALTSTGPAPGYLAGGANQNFPCQDCGYQFTVPLPSPPHNQPAQKSYLDYNTIPDFSWEITEPSITYQGAYVRLIAFLATEGGTSCPPAGTPCDDGNPNTTNDQHDGNCNCIGTPIQNNCELITNGGFDTNTADWGTWACNPLSSNGLANITAINGGANAWDAGFSQQGVRLEQGKNYTVTFRARANNNRSMAFKLGLAGPPHTSYLYRTANLGTSMQTYTYDFRMDNATDNNTSVEFLVGSSSSDVYIDDVSVKEEGCDDNNCPPEGTPCNDNNPATYDDREDGNCNCIGTPCPLEGTACDDGNPATYNDKQDGLCNCVGTPCPLEGTTCDDGNPNTINDVHDGFCNCAGTPIQTGDCKLLTNGDFDTDVANWDYWACNPYSVNGIANITTIQAGANAWDAGFLQKGVRLEQGKNYTITFRARASNNRSIILKVGLANPPHNSYFDQIVNLSSGMNTYTYNFNMNTSDNNASVDFLVGASIWNVYIDHVNLTETGCETTCETLSNGSFDANVSGWDSWSCSPNASGGIANITNINAGSNTWDAGFTQENLSFEQGKTYTISLRARASANRSIDLKLGGPGPNWTTYDSKTFNLTTSMQTHTFAFTMNNSTDANARFEIFLGGNAANVYIDEVSMSAACNNNKQDLSVAQDIQLYPNPANQSIQLLAEISENTQAQIQIYNAFGKLVKHITKVELLTGSSVRVEVAQLPPGVYFCTVQSDKWQAVKKFVIAR